MKAGEDGWKEGWTEEGNEERMEEVRRVKEEWRKGMKNEGMEGGK